MRSTPPAVVAAVFLLAAGAAVAQPAQPAPAPPAPAPSPVAPSEPADGQVAHLLHSPAGSAAAGAPFRIVAVIDGLTAEPSLVARYRTLGSGGAFREVAFERSSAGGWYAIVPAAAVERPGLEYYLTGRTADGRERLHFASEVDPHPVVIEPSTIVRQAEADAARMGGRVDVVSVDVFGHDFGNRYDRADDPHRDDFLRGEAAWTHHFLRQLYAVTMGYGLIQGRTPDSEFPTAESRFHAAHYGFAEARVRAGPAIFVDGRVAIGVDREGFISGGGAALTLGRPWRSCVTLGVEGLEHLGPTSYLRLQWDTVPPFIMGASIVKTDLPGATIDDGLFVKYDVSYPVIDRLSVRAALSYGARDGKAHFGGGLGTALAF